MTVKSGAYATCGRCGEEFKHPWKIPSFYGGAYCPTCEITVAREERERQEARQREREQSN